MTTRILGGVLLLCWTLLATGCLHYGEVGLREVGRRERTTAYGFYAGSGADFGGALSAQTVNFLNARLASERYDGNPEGLLRELEAELAQDGDWRVLEVLSDVSFCRARTLSGSAATVWYLSTAVYAYRFLERFDGTFEPGGFEVVRRYNASVSELAMTLRSNGLLFGDAYTLRDALGRRVTFLAPRSGAGVVMARGATAVLRPCADFEPLNFNFFSYRFGIGAPFLMTHGDVKADADAPERIRYMRNVTLPVTLMLRFNTEGGGGGRSVGAQWEFFDPDRQPEYRIGKRDYALSADFTTPLAYQLHYASRKLNTIWYMLHPDLSDDLEGLYLNEPYAPEKIPVLFIHGLMSSPHTWAQLFNTLRDDPEIRKRYQFWFYSYSSGYPIMYTARRLRQTLAAAERRMVKGEDPEALKNFRRMVIVGHSMGGLVARALVAVQPDGRLERAVLGDSIQALEARGEITDREAKFFREIFEFKPLPGNLRVVFFATPHRGADMAELWIGRLGSYLTRLPVRMVVHGAELVVRARRGGRGGAREIEAPPTGIDNLRTDNRARNALAELPFAPDVRYHSIIGNRDAYGIPGGSDGIVPYTSAHLDGAESELIVKSDHSVQSNALTALELRRILKLHLGR